MTTPSDDGAAAGAGENLDEDGQEDDVARCRVCGRTRTTASACGQVKRLPATAAAGDLSSDSKKRKAPPGPGLAEVTWPSSQNAAPAEHGRGGGRSRYPLGALSIAG
jgi:hypothetical protein